VNVFSALPLLGLLLVSPAFGHGTTATSADISLDEKLGAVIPADIVLKDENGRPVNLRSLSDRPLIIAPVYLHCSHVCPLLLTNLAGAIGKMDLVNPGKDFRVVALSFDEREGPEVAREKKPNYLAAVGKPFPADAWSFLTGDNANIRKFTDAVGFTFQRDGEDFSHPVVVIVLAPGGKVVRYLYGTSFLPFELTMAVTEAARGTIGSPAARVLNYCFSYDPLKKSYVFNILKVTGTVMVLFVGGFLLYLVMSTKKHRRETS
jgi:protein SCO1/2